MLQVDFVDRSLSKAIRGGYPQPIAYRFDLLARAVKTDKPDWFKAANLMIDLCELVMQYGSAIAVQSYIQVDEIKSDKATLKIRSLQEKLFSPGDWCELLRETLRCFIGHKDKLFIPELLSFYWQSQKENMTKTAAFLNEVPKLRNEEKGHAWVKEDSDKFVEKHIPRVGTMLSELDFLRKYSLFVPTEKGENNYDIALFEGDGKPDSEVIQTQAQLNLRDAYIVLAENFETGNLDEVLCLSPLVVYEECPGCPTK